MGLELNYDAFVGLSFGFFVACITVRVAHILSSGFRQARTRLRRDRRWNTVIGASG